MIEKNDDIERKNSNQNDFMRSMGHPMFVKVMKQMNFIRLDRNYFCYLVQDRNKESQKLKMEASNGERTIDEPLDSSWSYEVKNSDSCYFPAYSMHFIFVSSQNNQFFHQKSKYHFQEDDC